MTTPEPDFQRPGTTNLARDTNLGTHILGLCELATKETRLSPQAHEDRSQQRYTLIHEGLHNAIFTATTFGYMQFLLAQMERVAESGQLPVEWAGYQEALGEMMAVSWEAHEGFATFGEYQLHDALKIQGLEPAPVSRPTPQYEQAMAPYRDVSEALPRELRPFASFVLRAFAEAVFDTDVLTVARRTRLNVAEVRASLADPSAQPNYRLERLSTLFVERVGGELGQEWSYFTRLAARVSVEELSRMIAELRGHPPTAEAVQLRRTIRSRAREAVRTVFRAGDDGLVQTDGIATVIHFHNWCHDEFRNIPLLEGPMRSFGEPGEYAKHLVENLSVSGQPVDVLDTVILEPNLSQCVNYLLQDPSKRLAVALRVHEHVAERPDPVCQLRIARFSHQTDSWNGTGTEPYQRVFADPPCLEQYYTVADATSFFEQLRDRIDIIYFNSGSLTQSVARIQDQVVGETKAAMIYPVDSLAKVETDRHRVEALTRLEAKTSRQCVPYTDDDWVALFREIATRTFVGAVVLRMALAGVLKFEHESFLGRLGESQNRDSAEDRDYLISLGSLSTFAKLYIHGAFLDR